MRRKKTVRSDKPKKAIRQETEAVQKKKAVKKKTIIQEKVLLQAAGYLFLDGMVSYLFFRSLIAFALLLPGYVIYYRHLKQRRKLAELRSMRREFLDGMQYALGALESEYSMENAVEEAYVQVQKIYPRDSFIVRELGDMVRGIHLNISVEQLFTDLGRRSGVEEIREFADVFRIARACGGDLTAITAGTISGLQRREQTRQEIETILAGKQMEQTIMSLVPLFILAYVTLTSPGLMDPMYRSISGRLVMTGSLMVYLAAYFWGVYIMRVME